MLGVLPKSQGIANKKMTSQSVRSSFACYSLFSIFCFSLFLILVFFFMLFPNPAILFLHHPAQFPVLSLLACQP